MSTTRLLAAFSTALLISGILAGCGDDSPRSPLTPTGPTPPGPAPVTLTRLELTGPTTVHVGEPAQFTATAHQSDGSTRDVTNEVKWQSHPGILPMSSPGQFTGGAKGETSVSVFLNGRSAVTGMIIVVPSGTYRLMGTVRDEGVPLRADSVVIEDEAIGRSIVRLIDGVYKVYGVAGFTRITVSKDGYETAVKQQTISSHQTIDFDLVLSRPRDDVSGRYTLTFTAASECTALPEEIRARSYPARVNQSGPSLEVTLEDGRFLSRNGRLHNRFRGVLEPLKAQFSLTGTGFDYYNYYYALPDVFEELSGSVFFGVEGFIDATITSHGFSGTLSGAIGVYSGPVVRPLTRCRSNSHRVSLTR